MPGSASLVRYDTMSYSLAAVLPGDSQWERILAARIAATRVTPSSTTISERTPLLPLRDDAAPSSSASDSNNQETDIDGDTLVNQPLPTTALTILGDILLFLCASSILATTATGLIFGCVFIFRVFDTCSWTASLLCDSMRIGGGAFVLILLAALIHGIVNRKPFRRALWVALAAIERATLVLGIELLLVQAYFTAKSGFPPGCGN